MPEDMNRLSDAAKSVVDRTIAGLQPVFTQDQMTGLRQLAANGRFFDVEALMCLADVTSSEATNGN